MTSPAEIRAASYEAALAVIHQLDLPPGTALAATGSFARREMTPRSDLDLILLHGADTELDPELVSNLWYPVWEAKYHLDYAVRTPQECAAIAEQDASAGFAQLDLGYVVGSKKLVDVARAQLLAAWRRQLQRSFDSFIDTAIARWRRSGAVATMTNPDLKNGRGGLRDIQLLRALSLGNLCDNPDLSEQKNLLLDVRTLLHVQARRHRDTLDPEFAADIAHDLGFADRYELNAELVRAATAIDRALERGLAVARGVIGKRSVTDTRRPLDVDVVDAAGQIMLSRKPNLDDPWLLTRVAAAAARTGRPIAPVTWEQLQQLPDPPERWPKAAVDDFYAAISSPEDTPRLIRQLDQYGLWEKLVPDWAHIRGLLPRERTHIHSVDSHTIATVASCAQQRTTVARPDLLLLAALFHDIGKGYNRPHEQVGAELVTRQAARMRFDVADRSRVQTIVAEHTTLARLAARMDPRSDEAREALLDAAHYDPLIINLLAVLARSDAESTGPGVWTTRLASAVEIMTSRALEALQPGPVLRPVVGVPRDIDGVGLRVDWEEDQLSVLWRGNSQAEAGPVLALIAALGWTVVRSRMVRGDDGGFAAEFDIRTVQQTLADAADEARFIQSFKSGTYSRLPEISSEPTTAEFQHGGILVVRTVERIGALGHLIAALPEMDWMSHEIMGATMIVHIQLRGPINRAAVVGNVTAALVND